MSRTWIQMYSGTDIDLVFDYEHPEAFTWPVITIAHHLAHIIRYTGAVRRPYTVAEHSFRVSLYSSDLARAYGGDPLKAARMGLMHDASEAPAGDVNSPLKNMPFMAGYKAFEKSLHPMVVKRFGLEATWANHMGRPFDVVVSADLRALGYERAQLLGKAPQPWSDYDILPDVESDAFKGELGMPPEEAEQLFLGAAKTLGLK